MWLYGVAYYSFKSFDIIICACMVRHIGLLSLIQLFVPVWCGTLQFIVEKKNNKKLGYNYLCLYGVAYYSFKSFNIIICSCMVRHITDSKVRYNYLCLYGAAH